MSNGMKVLIIVTCLLVCVAAIVFLVLVGMGLVVLQRAQQFQISQSKSAVAQMKATEIAKFVQLYVVDNGLTAPDNTTNLSVLVAGADPYVKPKDLIDPWGRPFVLTIPGSVNTNFDVISLGADGMPGGSGEDADVVGSNP